MIYGIFIIALTLGVSFFMIDSNSKFDRSEKKMLQLLAVYHVFFAFVYYIYAQFNSSDSKIYYFRTSTDYRTDTWLELFKPGTEFIEFVVWPMIKLFGFTYEACMFTYSFLGFIGFYYFYLFFKERIKFRHNLFGIDLLVLVMFLPNMHFWTVSLGKGSLIFCGIGLFTWALNKFRTRIIGLAIGAFIIYGVRVPVLLAMLIGAAIGILLDSKKLGSGQKIIGLLVGAVGLFFVSDLTSNFLQLDQIGDLTSYYDNRGRELSRHAGSGIDITNYNLLQKIFAFLFRPLFIDGVNALGLVVSIENLFYLILLLKIMNGKALSFFVKGDYMVKMSLISFIGTSLALSQITGNLGIAIRLKTMVMYSLIFVVIQYLDDKKMKQYFQLKKKKLIKSQKGFVGKIT